MKKLESEGADYRWLDRRKVSSCYWINGMLHFPVVPAAPPILFNPPNPHTELAVGSMPRAHDCCYKYGIGEYHCASIDSSLLCSFHPTYRTGGWLDAAAA
jgi:hypothetical protein